MLPSHGTGKMVLWLCRISKKNTFCFFLPTQTLVIKHQSRAPKHTLCTKLRKNEKRAQKHLGELFSSIPAIFLYKRPPAGPTKLQQGQGQPAAGTKTFLARPSGLPGTFALVPLCSACSSRPKACLACPELAPAKAGPAAPHPTKLQQGQGQPTAGAKASLASPQGLPDTFSWLRAL